MLQLNECPVKNLKSVGEVRSKQLSKIGVNTVEDLLFHLPKRYEDRRAFKKIIQLVPGKVETLYGKVLDVEVIKPRPKLSILKCTLTDGRDTIKAVWFNRTYLKNTLKKGTEIIVTGKVTGGFFGLEISVRDFEILDNKGAEINTGRIVPVYPATEKLTQRFLRTIIFDTIHKYSPYLKEILPFSVRKYRKIPPLGWAIKNIHFPSSLREAKFARNALAYEELFLLQFALFKIKKDFKKAKGICHLKNTELLKKFIEGLPFSLTGAQKRVWQEIEKDMEAPFPMARLIQGDVGSGKTILAALSLIKCCAGGFQGALMAPTEILAEQHKLEFEKLLKDLDIKIGFLVGSLKAKEKEELLKSIEEGNIDIVIGTHALIQKNVKFKNLGLVVIDEQHRFGVNQRSALNQKGVNPDMLVMTATPIPRTLALTLYGDLDVSVIDEMPPGRKEIITRYVSEKNRDKVYKFIEQQIKEGRQCYIVCPLVEESEKLDLEAAQTMAEKLQKDIFKNFKVGLLHGKLSASEKETVMEDFRNNKINILVATTVVEVGVNVPNASIMLIEGAERFGLAQLHQLRGRIGRGAYQSYCILMGSPKSVEAKKRILVMTKTNDGFKIAEEDLNLRGPGEFFGIRQHGLPELRVANIVRDQKILQMAKDDVLNIFNGKFTITKEEYHNLKNYISKNLKIESI